MAEKKWLIVAPPEFSLSCQALACPQKCWGTRLSVFARGYLARIPVFQQPPSSRCKCSYLHPAAPSVSCLHYFLTSLSLVPHQTVVACMTLPVVVKLPLLLLRRAIARLSPREDSGTGTTIASPSVPAPTPMKMSTERKENVKWVEVSVRSFCSPLVLC
jgi:hypothetical protein